MPLPLEKTFDLEKLEATNPNDIQPSYTNNAACLMAPHDLRIVFTEIISDGPYSNPRLELRANIVMTPTMMKALYEAIGQTIVAYEEKNGEIKWPPQQPATK